MISSGDVAAAGMAGERKVGSASLEIRRAIAVMLSSRVWLATITGPNRQSAGNDQDA